MQIFIRSQKLFSNEKRSYLDFIEEHFFVFRVKMHFPVNNILYNI